MLLRRFAFVAAVLGLSACDYTAERDLPVTRLVEDDGVCPTAESVAAAQGAEDAERTEWHTVEVGALCYYEILANEDGRPLRCYGPRPSFEAIQAEAKQKFAPNSATGQPSDLDSDTMCTEGGQVLIVPADGATCPTEAPDLHFGWKMGELLATDARSPYRFCKYEATYEYKKTPFSCGGSGVFAPE